MQNLFAKTAGVVVAIALLVGVAVPAANALTVSEITALLVGAGIDAETAATLAAVLGDSEGSSSSSSCYSYARDLTVGSTGADVAQLQTMLVNGGYLTIPVGVSKGYFGSLTQSALASWQAANSVSPASGYFGPITRSAIPCDDSGDMGDDDDDRDTSGMSNSEASLEQFEANEDEDEVAEGDSEIVGTFEFDVEDGDVEIQRLDLTFVGVSTPTEDDVWDAIDEVTLYLDGDEIASEDVSDESDWLDDDSPFVFRFSGLDAMVMEGDTAVIEVEITANNNVDDAGTDAAWRIYVDTDDIRALDGAGIDQYIGDSSETIDFEIVSEGEGDDLDLESSSDDPDATTIILSEDDRTEEAIFAFELSADDSDNDVEINEIQMVVEISSSTGDLDDVVNDFYIEIDGDRFDAESYTAVSSTTLVFDVDGDFTVDADETATVVLFAEFEDMESTSDYQGVTISASTTAASIDAEGRDDITVDGSAQDGDAHTLRSEGIYVEMVSEDFNLVDGDSDDTGVFTIEMEVSAFGDDFYIDDSAASSTSAGVAYSVSGTTATDSATLSTSGDDEGSSFLVRDGETETLTLKVNVTTGSSQNVRITLGTVYYDAETMSDDSTPDNSYSVTPAKDNRTEFYLVTDN